MSAPHCAAAAEADKFPPATDVAATIVAGSHADNVDLAMVADRREPRWSQTGPGPMSGRPSERGCFMTATRSTR
ncbi:hypothetical protein ACIG56_33875 [Nocardia fusca]|uniref:hypothetical protein n=1 Tax=Nocardia fusca TaxID=941183 RepID=UPI0037CB2A11